MAYPIEAISSLKLLCGEGPIWDEKNKFLYWTESLGDSIYKYVYNDQGSGDTLFHKGISAASLALHQNGGLVISGKEGFSLLLPGGQTYNFNNKAEGVSVSNLNDIIADPNGRIFSGQEAFIEDKEYETGYLFRLDNNGDLKIVAEGLHLSNGMGFSPDCAMFYLADSILRKVYEFDYNAATGDIRNQRELIHFGREDGLPDGMTVDSEGFIWVAMFFRSKIVRLDPDGVIEREIKLPFTQPTSVTFGGKDLNELFITSASFHWETEYAPENHNYHFPKGGNLYRMKTDFQGKEEFKAATLISSGR